MIRSGKEGREFLKELERQPNKFVFGMEKPIFYSVLALITPMQRDSETGKKIAQSHILILDLPGRGKTAIFVYLSSAMKAKIGKIEGRADMMPNELTGGEKIDLVTGKRTLFKGPLHSHVFFFDETTRTPSRGQSVLLGPMDGGHVLMNKTDEETGFINSVPFPLYPIPGDRKNRNYFIAMATANPLEFEGTFPMSEALKERFVYSFSLGLPSREEEMKVTAENVSNKEVEVVGNLSDIMDINEMVETIKLSSKALEYRQRLMENSRPKSRDIIDYGSTRRRYASGNLVEYIEKYVDCGCSTRRNFHMEAAAKAWAFMRGEKEIATVEDMKAIAPITMEHVILLSPATVGDSISAREVVKKIIDETEVP
jgi:MoxR-like ATPase